jgi:hypothetical protein
MVLVKLAFIFFCTVSVVVDSFSLVVTMAARIKVASILLFPVSVVV